MKNISAYKYQLAISKNLKSHQNIDSFTKIDRNSLTLPKDYIEFLLHIHLNIIKPYPFHTTTNKEDKDHKDRLHSTKVFMQFYVEA